MTVAQLVARERMRLSIAIIARGVAMALAIALILAAISAVALGDARWITHPSAPLAAWLAAGILVCSAIWYSIRDLRGSAGRDRVAAAIERERALRAGSLRGALEVGTTGPLGERASRVLADRLRPDWVLAPVMQWRAWRLGLIAMGAATAGMFLLGAARDAAPDGWRALRHPVGAWTGSLLQPLSIVDPPRAVMRGERVQVRIRASERRFVSLERRVTGASWRSEVLPVSSGIAVTMLGPLDADVMLVASDERSASDTVIIKVTDRPFVGDVAIRAEYPAYLRKRAEVLPAGEPIRVPRGTALSIRGRASTELMSVALAHSADTLRLTPDGHRFSGRLSAVASGKWQWTARFAGGLVPDMPAPLDIEVVPDSAPRVEMLAPPADTVVLATDQIDIRASAADDHGLAAIALRSWRVPEGGSALPEVSEAIAAPREPEWSGQVSLNLAERGLEPGDELHIVFAATDGSPWRQRAESRELVLRVPSLSERREMARTLADSAAARASAAARSQRQLEQRTGEAVRSRGQREPQTAEAENQKSEGAKSAAMSSQSADKARALAKEQEQLREQIKAIEKDARALEQQLHAAGALDSSLARQLREVQKLLSEALSGDMAQQLQKLTEAAQRLSSEDVRRSLSELAAAQERLREQLEKSAGMLKRAALEGAMQTLSDDAKELAVKERAMADSMARGEKSAAERARPLAERSRDLAREIDELASRLKKDKAEAGPEKLRAAAKNAERSAEALRQAAGSPESKEGARPPEGERAPGEEARSAQDSAQQKASQEGSQAKAGAQGAQSQTGEQNSQSRSAQAGAQTKAAQEGAQQMEQAAQKLAEARESQINEWKEDLTGELDRSIQEMLQLAREQDALAQRAQSGAQPGPLRGEQSAIQQGAERVGERLQQQAGKSAHVSPRSQGAVGEARRKVQEATRQLDETARGNSQAASAMQEAASALNSAAGELVRDRERAARAQSASGFAEMLQRMQEMAKQQGQINAQAAGLLPIPGQQISEAAANQARALGKQQRGMARQLDESGQDDASGRAAELAKEMRQLAEAMEQGRLDPSVLGRQQQLFRRLLDAGLSLEKEEREDRGERESRSASDEEALTPGGDARGRDAMRYREPAWNELRGLTPEERRAVLEYFKRINAERP
ncbi:MAG: hypothetical protein H7Z74_17615 [Anaerolineae bacterium]|nr:hypothetical protein [Gemmatimonadaceae bacterium]